MGKRLTIIAGNGITIDFLAHCTMLEAIDPSNLFKFGSHVPWPGSQKPGFLSYRYCPNLWNLGARPSMSATEATNLIEDIITCANVFGAAAFSQDSVFEKNNSHDIYIQAYHELLVYLRSLFVYYDHQFPDLDASKIEKWNWFKFIKSATENGEYEAISIITYCYDIWLERVFRKFNIPFHIGGFENPSSPNSIEILKPHGSISFCHTTELPRDSFIAINRRDRRDSASPSDFSIRYTDLDRVFPVIPLIPPAGQSARLEQWLTSAEHWRMHGEVVTGTIDPNPQSVEALKEKQAKLAASNQGWAEIVRREAMKAARNLKENDELVITGLSYWHVDRDELDSLLVSAHPGVEVKMVHPAVPRGLNAVLTSLFKNYQLLTSASILAGAH